MSVVVLVGAVLAVAAAGVLQRVTGIGYALVATPALLVAVGPDETVRLVTATSLVTCAIALASTWQHCRWGEVAALLPFVFLAMWPAGALAEAVGESVAMVVAGVVVLAAVAVSLRPQGFEAVPQWARVALAGGLSGAMNAAAAIGGPMAAAYGISRRWGASLVPNLQIVLLLSAFGVLAVRGWPARTTPTQVAVLATAAGLGVVGGGWLSERLSGRWTWVPTVLVAVLGASVAVVRGLVSLTH